MDTQLLQLIGQTLVQIIALISTGLTLYYRLKGRVDSNTQDIKNILDAMHNNGFATKADLTTQVQHIKEINDRQNTETDRLRTRVDTLSTRMDVVSIAKS